VYWISEECDPDPGDTLFFSMVLSG
jgi:hypothetical protein